MSQPQDISTNKDLPCANRDGCGGRKRHKDGCKYDPAGEGLTGRSPGYKCGFCGAYGWGHSLTCSYDDGFPPNIPPPSPEKKDNKN